ncbi:MAG: transposase [Flavobacteriales bacterium Tduv]
MNKTRWVVERTFGSIRSWFELGKTRYKRLARLHTQPPIEAIGIICIVPLELLCLFIKIDIIN